MMVRNYIKKTTRGNFSAESLTAALDAIKKGTKVRVAAREHDISHSTLLRYMKKGTDEVQKPGVDPVFSDDEQKKLVYHILECANTFHGLSLKKTRELAFSYAVELKKTNIPKSWHENQCAGEDWEQDFRKRHKSLSLRSPEPTSMARAKAFNKENVALFFNLYEKTVQKYHITPERIFNLDETGVTTVQKPGKILASKGKKQVGMIASAERGSLVTVCNAVSASGQALPPVFLFPRVNFKDIMLKGAPFGSLGLAIKSGWMTTAQFPQALKHFMKHMKVSKENRAILLMDNHSSHVSLEVKEMARDCGLSIVTFPPHCSHKLQPLDVSVYGPFKKFYNQAATNWMTSNVGKVISIYEVAELTSYAFNKSMTIENIISGFRATGIYPYNPHVFAEDAFLPSEVLQGNTEPKTLPEIDVFKLPKATISDNPCRKRAAGRAQILTATPESAASSSSHSGVATAKPRKRISLFKKRKRQPATEDSESTDDEDEPVPLDDDSDDDQLESLHEIHRPEGEQHTEQLEVGSFVLVKFEGKRRSVCYVGQVLAKEDTELQIDFYRKSENSLFKKPPSGDVKYVGTGQIEQVLPYPTYTGQTARTFGSIRFECNFNTEHEVN